MTTPDEPKPGRYGRPRHTGCKVDGCDEPHYAKGYGRRHYDRWKKHGDPLVVLPPGRTGRKPVGTPTRQVRPSKTRAGRKATPHIRIRLAPNQGEQVAAHAARLAMSGAEVIRVAIDRLTAGDIPLPTRTEQVPPALPADDGQPLVPRTGHVDALDKLAAPLLDVLAPQDTVGARRGRQATQARNALIRWAVAQHLDPHPEA